MSSCCTLRLNRRRAFSRDSPSCSRTSAKLTHPQTRPDGPILLLQGFDPKSRVSGPNLWASPITGTSHFETNRWIGAGIVRLNSRAAALRYGESCCNCNLVSDLRLGREVGGPSQL